MSFRCLDRLSVRFRHFFWWPKKRASGTPIDGVVVSAGIPEFDVTELETKYHDSLAVVKDLEGRMKANKELRYQVAAYTSTKNITQQLKTAKRPAAFEEQHRAELTAYRVAAAYFKANDITKLPSPKKLEAEYAQLASEKAKFYEQYKEAKEELLKLKTAKQNVASFFREEEQTQQEKIGRASCRERV